MLYNNKELSKAETIKLINIKFKNSLKFQNFFLKKKNIYQIKTK